MTVELERTFELAYPPEAVWSVLSDPAVRAEAISVVEEYTPQSSDDGDARWHVTMPIPFVNSTVTVKTRDIERDPPNYVKFVGTSPIMEVLGEHEIEPTESGSLVHNRFTVTGSIPGVESFFKRNFDAELDNIHRAILESLEARP